MDVSKLRTADGAFHVISVFSVYLAFQFQAQQRLYYWMSEPEVPLVF